MNEGRGTLGASASRTQKRFVPERPEWLDLGFLAVLGLVAVHGLHDSYTGWQFLVVAALGIVLGMAIGHIGQVLRQPVGVVLLAAVLCYFVLGGIVALRSEGPSALYPGWGTLTDLADRGTRGWKELLTTLPPVDGAGPLLVLPWLLGLVHGALGVTLAQRTRSGLWAAATPVLLLSAVILLGAKTPGSPALQAVCFAVVLLAWLTVRSGRSRPVLRSRPGRSVQVGLAAALVAGCSLLAVPLAGHGPGSGKTRVVLRTWVQPPFDVGIYPSPLVSFRNYARNKRDPAATAYDKVVLTVSGVPTGTLVRFATLDRYDGRVWGAADRSPNTDGAEGTFQRVGPDVPTDSSGPLVRASITIGPGYHGNWLPMIGSLHRITFAGANAHTEGDSFRYNLATDTGILPLGTGLPAGSTYAVQAVLDDKPVPDKLADWSSLSAGPVPIQPAGNAAELQPQALEWGPATDSAMKRLAGIADTLHERGQFTNGDTAQTQAYGAGHFVSRLLSFVRGQHFVGDDEQFAATFALMANMVNVPARVVIGARTGAGGVVRGKDVHAWVEVQLRDGRWHTVPQTMFMDQSKRPSNTPPTELAQSTGDSVPPPRALQPPSTMGDPAVPNNSANRQKLHHHHGFALPAWVWLVLRWVVLPLLVIAVLVALVVGAKAVRRRRRRTRGSPGQRIANGWVETLDLMRDLGVRVPAGTRRQQAAVIGTGAIADLADRADRITFGPVDLTEQTVGEFWSAVDDVRHRVTAGLGFRARAWAALNPTTLRPRGVRARLPVVRSSHGPIATRPRIQRRRA